MLSDLERAKKCFESDAAMKVNAVMQAKLRVDLMAHYNTRGAERKKYQKKKIAKGRAKLLRAATKKRMFLFNAEKKGTGRVDEVWEHLHAP